MGIIASLIEGALIFFGYEGKIDYLCRIGRLGDFRVSN